MGVNICRSLVERSDTRESALGIATLNARLQKRSGA